jgi:hypothetical protein
MAKAIIEFDLNDYDDKMAHKRAVKSTDLALALWEIEVNLRKRLEMQLQSKELKNEDVDVYDVIDMCMENIFDTIKDHNIDIDDLIQ